MAGFSVEAGEKVQLLAGAEVDAAALEECRDREPGPSNRRFKRPFAAGLLVASALLASAASVAWARGSLGGGDSTVAVSATGLGNAVSLHSRHHHGRHHHHRHARHHATEDPRDNASNIVRNSYDCLCLFDVDRTLTVRQGFADACGPDTKEYPDVHDPAYGGGHLVVSAVGLHMEKTFCGQCHRGVISAGGVGHWNEKHVLGSHFGDYRWSHSSHIQSPLVHSCKNKNKHHCAKAIVDWLAAQGHFIEPDRVHFFDDHVGNTRGFQEEYGYNARLISCDTRDEKGKIGLCGAQLNEIVPDKGTWQCGA